MQLSAAPRSSYQPSPAPRIPSSPTDHPSHCSIPSSSQQLQWGAARSHPSVQLPARPSVPLGLGFWERERCGPLQGVIFKSVKLCVRV